MARRKRKGRNASAPQADLVGRLLERGDARQALKEARRCFRIDASHQHRQLLERALFGRVEQLCRLKQLADAKAVLGELMELPPSSAEIVEQLPRLQVVVGCRSDEADALLASDPALLAELTDQAILDPSSAVPNHADLRQQVDAVRTALADVERGADEAAAERLRQIPKNSPLADWRLLIRGLSAFYQQDFDRAKSNWARLDSSRPAWPIAQTLLAAVGQATDAQPVGDVTAKVGKLRSQVQSDGAIALARQLVPLWKQGNWPRFLSVYRQLRRRFSQSRGALIQEIVDLVWKRAVRDVDRNLLIGLSKIGPAPPVDPEWNRAWALLAESPDAPESIQDVENAWLVYARQVGELACLRPEERPIAVGLVYQRLGRLFRGYAQNEEQAPDLYGGVDQALVERLRDAAARHYRKSIEACPQLQETYLELAALHDANEEAGKAAQVMHKLARVDPDSFEAACWLANYYLSRDEPGKSEPHVATMLRLRPRDRACAALLWSQRLTMIRCLTIKRQFAAAHHEIDSAAEAAPGELELYFLDLLRATVEFKAKNLEAAQRHLDAALAKVDEPIAIWLQMSACAGRMRVAREIKKDFDDRFKAAIQGTPSSASAGRMARCLSAYKLMQANYTGRATQERLLLKCLERVVNKVAWQERDLRDVCELLHLVRCTDALRKRYVELGLTRFPQVPHYLYWAATDEAKLGTYCWDLDRLLQRLESALDLHNRGETPLDDEKLDHLQSTLSMVRDHREWAQMSRSAPAAEHEDDWDHEESVFDFFDMFGFGSPADEEDEPRSEADEARLERSIATLIRIMPPHLRQFLDEIASALGVSEEEALRIMIEKAPEIAGYAGGGGPGRWG